jgi:hypothetical protein
MSESLEEKTELIDSIIRDIEDSGMRLDGFIDILDTIKLETLHLIPQDELRNKLTPLTTTISIMKDIDRLNEIREKSHIQAVENLAYFLWYDESKREEHYNNQSEKYRED